VASTLEFDSDSAPGGRRLEFDSDSAPRSSGEELLRQLGLTARAGIQGTGDTLDLVASPIRVGLNAAGMNIQGRTGEALADTLGLPKPETRGERIVGKTAEAMVPGAAGIKGGQYLSRAATPVLQSIGGLLQSTPTSQIALSGLSGAASQSAAEAGAGPWGQMAAGFGAPVVASLGAKVATSTTQRLRDILSAVFTDNGATQAAGRVVTDVAGNRASAVPPNLRAGMDPETAAQAAVPAGAAELSGLERIIGKQDPSVFGPHGAVDSARAQWLKDEWARLNSQTGPIRERVLQQANAGASGYPLTSSPLLQEVQNLRSAPENSNLTAQGVLRFVEKELNRNTDQVTGALDATKLYNMRKDIGIKIDAMASKQKWDKKTAAKILGDFQKSMDWEIEKASGLIGSKGGSMWRDDYMDPFATRAQQLTGLDDRVLQSKEMGAAGAQKAGSISNMDEVPFSLPNVLSRPVMVVNFLMRILQGQGAKKTSEEISRLMQPKNKGELAALIEKELALRGSRGTFGQALARGVQSGAAGQSVSQ